MPIELGRIFSLSLPPFLSLSLIIACYCFSFIDIRGGKYWHYSARFYWRFSLPLLSAHLFQQKKVARTQEVHCLAKINAHFV